VPSRNAGTRGSHHGGLHENNQKARTAGTERGGEIKYQLIWETKMTPIGVGKAMTRSWVGGGGELMVPFKRPTACRGVKEDKAPWNRRLGREGDKG